MRLAVLALLAAVVSVACATPRAPSVDLARGEPPDVDFTAGPPSDVVEGFESDEPVVLRGRPAAQAPVPADVDDPLSDLDPDASLAERGRTRAGAPDAPLAEDLASPVDGEAEARARAAERVDAAAQARVARAGEALLGPVPLDAVEGATVGFLLHESAVSVDPTTRGVPPGRHAVLVYEGGGCGEAFSALQAEAREDFTRVGTLRVSSVDEEWIGRLETPSPVDLSGATVVILLGGVSLDEAGAGDAVCSGPGAPRS